MVYLVGRIISTARHHKMALVCWGSLLVVIAGGGWAVFEVSSSFYHDTSNKWWLVGIIGSPIGVLLAAVLSLSALRDMMFAKPLHRRG